MSELHHECGVAAIYHLGGPDISPICADPAKASRLMPRMLLDVQNRGQLAAGFTTFNADRNQLIDTHKETGSVTEAFRLSHRAKHESLMKEYEGHAAIGHVRYATCGEDDRSYAQPFERHHIEKRKWFSFGFNGQLANYQQLKKSILDDGNNHLTRDTDTEIIMHEISRTLSADPNASLMDICEHFVETFDGAYSMVYLNALGDLLVLRDPLGVKPLCYAKEGPLFAAASESVALLNLGFQPENIHSLLPGQAITIVDGEFQVETFARGFRDAHCFFEWIYFANVASTMDGRSVYLTRKALGEELARLEVQHNGAELDDGNTIVVPVPDTSKAAADAMAYKLNLPSVEGLIRNRYSGRTFIEGNEARLNKAQTKYTPLPEVLRGKRVLLVEDSIVRSTTMRVLIDRIRDVGEASEIHVRVASPPIIAPCFYGIDMSRLSELFAPKFVNGSPITPEIEAEMANDVGADSLRYLPVESIARAIGKDSDQLCQACITGNYPTEHGQRLYEIELTKPRERRASRAYEEHPPAEPVA
jgi:amidophosphoribosyltransferase